MTKPKTKEIRQCKQCGENFKAVPTRKGEFCSARCRVTYWRERKSDTALLDAMIYFHWRVVLFGTNWVVCKQMTDEPVGFGPLGTLHATGAQYRTALAKAIEYSQQTQSS